MPQIRCSKETAQADHYYRLLVTVTSVTDIDRNVFLYLALPQRGTDPIEAVFQGVCSPKDMVDVPATDPAPNSEPPWVRHDTIDLLFPCLSELNAAWTLIQDELDTLCLLMADLETLTRSEVVQFSHPG